MKKRINKKETYSKVKIGGHVYRVHIVVQLGPNTNPKIHVKFNAGKLMCFSEPLGVVEKILNFMFYAVALVPEGPIAHMVSFNSSKI